MSCSSTERPLTAREELAITRCMLFGCNMFYDDYGHPERALARKYYKCASRVEGAVGKYIVGYGHSTAEAALDWLRRTGNEGDLNVKK